MASGEMTPAALEALEHVKQGNSFVLDGGAGSGKTYTLSLLVGAVLSLSPEYRVACITYTNAAAGEIKKRYQSSRLSVSTIHDFLWSHISPFQRELRECIVDTIRSGVKTSITLPNPEADIEEVIKQIPKKIEYQNSLRLLQGAISHDQVIELSCKMISSYPKLARLIADESPVILVDEYQDTFPEVVDALLNHVAKDHKCVVGFFGDHMQSIYDRGVGSLLPFVKRDALKQVHIEENRRNSRAVLDFANRLRFDFKQIPSNDADAPNMVGGQLVEGNVHVVVGNDPNGIRIIRESQLCSGWVGDVQETWLTRRVVAREAGFSRLLELHVGNDPILKFAYGIAKDHPEERRSEDALEEVVRRYPHAKPSIGAGESFEGVRAYPFKQLVGHRLSADNLLANPGGDGMAPDWCPTLRRARQLYWIVDAYSSGDYYRLSKLIPVEINSVADKRRLNEAIRRIVEMDNPSLGEALNFAFADGLLSKGDDLKRFEREYAYVSTELLDITFAEYQAFFAYYDDETDFSTQHRTKGLEYCNEIVSLSNGNWNDYNFINVLNMTPEGLARELQSENPKESIVRSAHLLYVSATRAMENLVLYLDTGRKKFDRRVLLNWFEPDQIVELSDLQATD